MIALNHSFISGIARRPTGDALAALTLINQVRKRTQALPLVDASLSATDTGAGPLLVWGNRMKHDPEAGPLVELLLRMTSGPFLEGDECSGLVDPSIAALPDWLQACVRRLLLVDAQGLVGVVSPAPRGGADAAAYASAGRSVVNWHDEASFEAAFIASSAAETTLQVLERAAEAMAGQLVVLPTARRSAQDWTLDCSPAALHQALLGLEVYAAALSEGVSRELAAARYHTTSGTPMSQETSAVKKLPTRRRQREFVTPEHGTQYFDMHAKPGNMTRVHVWVATREGSGPATIYVGHCGRHLD